MHSLVILTADVTCHVSGASGSSSLCTSQTVLLKYLWTCKVKHRYSAFKGSVVTMYFKWFCTRYSRLFFTLSFIWYYYSGFLPYKASHSHNVLRAQYPQLHTLLIISVIFIFSPSFYVELPTYIIAFWSIVISHQHSKNILPHILLYFKIIF